jgi:hypothetical protein
MYEQVGGWMEAERGKRVEKTDGEREEGVRD